MTTFEQDSQYEYATFRRRLLAMILDQLILLIPVLIIALTIGVMIGIFIPTYNEAMLELIGNFISVIITWLYYAIMESSAKKATFGKLLLRLQVTDLNGDRISFMRATGRYFGKIISGMILLIGYFMVLFTDRKQGLHDMMAGCLVLKKLKPETNA